MSAAQRQNESEGEKVLRLTRELESSKAEARAREMQLDAVSAQLTRERAARQAAEQTALAQRVRLESSTSLAELKPSIFDQYPVGTPSVHGRYAPSPAAAGTRLASLGGGELSTA